MTGDDTLELDDGLRALARVVNSNETLESALQRIVEVTERVVPGALGASLTVHSPRGPHTVVATNETVRSIDQEEYALGEGPCLTALETGLLQRLDDTSDDNRWPRFNGLMKREGLGSVLGLPLCLGDDVLGALNVYARAALAFTEESVRTAELLSEQAVVTFASTRN